MRGTSYAHIGIPHRQVVPTLTPSVPIHHFFSTCGRSVLVYATIIAPQTYRSLSITRLMRRTAAYSLQPEIWWTCQISGAVSLELPGATALASPAVRAGTTRRSTQDRSPVLALELVVTSCRSLAK